MELGHVLEVSTRLLGAHASSATGATALSIPVTTVNDFASTEDGGGQVDINGTPHDYTGFSGSDEEGWTLQLATGLASAVAEDDEILVLPFAEEKKALVDLGDGGDGKTATIDHPLHDMFEDGIREEANQENVGIEIRSGERYIVDVYSKTPESDGTYIDPATLPVGSGGGTDGLPPDNSPTVIADGGVEMLFLSWGAITNADPVTYDVYISTAAGVTATPENLAGSTDATVFVQSYPAGMRYALVVPRDDDGVGPASLEVSGEVLAQVDLTGLNQQLDANTQAIDTLNTTTIPALQTDLDTNTGAISTLNTTTIPALQADLDTAEGQINTLNTTTIPALQADLDTAEGQINTLNTTTIPALQTDLDTAEGQINTLNTTTIPALQADLDTAEGQINTLNTTTIPGLDTRLGTAEGEVDAVQAKFPITAPDIAANAVTANAVLAGAIVAGKIATDAVTAATIAAGAIVAGKLAAGAVTAGTVAAGVITATMIAANTITAGQIATGAITADEVAAGAIIAGKIATDAVTAGTVAAGAIVAGKIATDAVTAGTVAAGAIIAGKIAANAVTAGTIAANVVTATQVNAGAIVAGKIAADAVTATTVAAGAIIAGKIATDAVTANTVAANAIIAGKINAGAVVAGTIAANAVVAASIASGAIVAGKIASGAVTAGTIAAGAVVAGTLAAGAVTAGTLAAGAVTATSIASDAITGKTITGGLFRTSAAGERIEISAVDAGLIDFMPGASYSSSNAKIYVDAYSTPGDALLDRQYLTLASPSHVNSPTNRARLDLFGGRDQNEANIVRTTAWLNADYVRANAVKMVLIESQQTMRIYNAGASGIELDGPGATYIEGTTEMTGQVRAQSDIRTNINGVTYGGFIDENYVGGGGSPANYNNNGRIIRAGSLASMKRNIEPLTLDEAMTALRMESATFQWREDLDLGDARQGGFIADQADAVGADLWVTHDEDDNPTGIHYGEVTAAHNVIIKDLLKRIEDLEGAR